MARFMPGVFGSPWNDCGSGGFPLVRGTPNHPNILRSKGINPNHPNILRLSKSSIYNYIRTIQVIVMSLTSKVDLLALNSTVACHCGEEQSHCMSSVTARYHQWTIEDSLPYGADV